MRKYCIPFLVLLLQAPYLSAQINTGAALTEKLTLEVKQLNQFFERFNHLEDGAENAITKPNAEERQKYILALFDREYLTKAEDSLRAKVGQFVLEATDKESPLFLHYEDGYWFAKIEAIVEFEGKEEQIRCLMQVVGDNKNGYQWLFRDAYAPFLAQRDKPRTYPPLLPPNTNETNFISISKVFDKKEGLLGLTSNGYHGDHLRLLLEMGEKGLIDWKHVQKISYHLFQLDGWALTVDWFSRDSLNSGWLISSLEQLPTEYRDAQIGQLAKK